MSELKKELGFWDVFSVSAGAMVSSGLFVLPALAYAQSGSGVILAYVLASIMVFPSVLSKAELATAMPKAGGTYFFVERSMGGMWGMFSGLAGWFSLAMKSAFAVVGMMLLVEVVVAQFSEAVLEGWMLKGLGVFMCLGFCVINIVSVKHTSRFQFILVMALIAILILFVILGAPHVDGSRHTGYLEKGLLTIFATAGLVFVSFGGITKVASVAEEVRNPGRNIPMGMITACLVVTALYIGVIAVTLGLLPGETLSVSTLPISEAAQQFSGQLGFFVLCIAAIAAFITTANGGILAASRAPMAMAKDRLLPFSLCKINTKFQTPHISILLTGLFMIVVIVGLDLKSLVKTASTIKILLFILTNVSVIMMRESRIQSYRPAFRSPGYPYIHIAAIAAYLFLIVDMGLLPLSITGGFFLVSATWYHLYAKKRSQRASAAMHIVERVTDKELQSVTLENELRDILLQRDEIIEDRFDQLIRDCKILDFPEACESKTVFTQVAEHLESRVQTGRADLLSKFVQREREASTVIETGLAIPHVVVEGEHVFDVVLVRSTEGIRFPDVSDPVHVMFVLVGSRDERNYHLRALMAIAQIAQQEDFRSQWMQARDTEGLRNVILLSARKRDGQ